jgi:long-chain acyl-CoA synthetase
MPSASPQSLADLFLAAAEAEPDKVLIRAKVAGTWTRTTLRQWQVESTALARGLVACGVEPGDRVLLVANTRKEWLVADIAIALAGAVTVPVYHSALPDEARYIAQNSGAKVALVEHPGQLAKLWSGRAELPMVSHYVTMDDLWVPEQALGSQVPPGPPVPSGAGAGRPDGQGSAGVVAG